MGGAALALCDKTQRPPDNLGNFLQVGLLFKSRLIAYKPKGSSGPIKRLKDEMRGEETLSCYFFPF